MLVINEVVYDPPGNDAACYIEILGPAGTDLTGYSLKFFNGTGAEYTPQLPLAGSSIGANGYFLVVQDVGVVVPAGANALISSKANMQNGPDSVQLVQTVGNVTSVIDALGYGTFGAGQTFLGEGMPATLPANSQKSLSRLPNGTDNNNNLTDFAAGIHTPGAPNAAM